MNKAESALRLACSSILVMAAFVGGNAFLVVVSEHSEAKLCVTEPLSDVKENSLDLDSFSDTFEEFCCSTFVTSRDGHQLRLEPQRDQAFDLPYPLLQLTDAAERLLEVAPEVASEMLALRGQDQVFHYAMTPACWAAPSA